MAMLDIPGRPDPIPSKSTDALKIFISYSRRDRSAADLLVAALESRGFAVMIDKRDLPFGEKWQEELAEFIRASDTVIWLVSTQSVASKWCHWELDEVLRRKKRLIPVMIGETPRDELPRQLGEIHILPSEGVFDASRDLDALSTTLEADREWLKEHTRLADRAREWVGRSNSKALLLRGAALKAAEAWKDRRPAKAPAPSEEILDLILMSRRAGTRRQRALIGVSLAIALGAIAAAGLIYLQALETDRQRQVAQANEVRAVQQEKLAVERKRLAEESEQKTVQTLASSDFQQGTQLLDDDERVAEGLAFLTRSLRQGHDERAAIRLWTALQQRNFFVPVRVTTGKPLNASTWQPLAANAFGPKFAEHQIGGKTLRTQSISRSGDGTRIFTSVGMTNSDHADPQFRIWTADGKPVTPWIKIDQTGVENWIGDRFGYLSHDGQLLALEICPWRATCYLELWDLKSQKRIGDRIVASGASPVWQNIGFAYVGFITLPAAQETPEATLLLTASSRGDAKAYLIDEDVVRELVVNKHQQAAAALVTVDQSGEWLMSAATDGTVIVSKFAPDDLERALQEPSIDRFTRQRRLGVTFRFESQAVQLSRTGKQELVVVTADGKTHTFKLLPTLRMPVNPADSFVAAKDNCMGWLADTDPTNDKSLPNLARTISISQGRLVRFLGPRQLAVESGGAIASSPLFQSDIEIVCANGPGDEVSVTTTDFVTQIWDSQLKNKIGPPLDEKRLFGRDDAAGDTRWVKLHSSGRYALSASTSWNPPASGDVWLSLWDRRTGLPLMDRQHFGGLQVGPNGTEFDLDQSQDTIRFSTDTSDGKGQIVWHLQIAPSSQNYVWLADFAEALGGIALNSNNIPEPVVDRNSKLEAGVNALAAFK
jgi:hypothetical protein